MVKLVRITTVPMSFNLLKGQMAFMIKNGFEVTLISAIGSQIKEIVNQEGCPHYSIPLTRKITPFKDLRALFILYRYLKKTKPQIVHSHTPKAGTVGMIAAKLAGVPIRLHTTAGLPLLESKGIKRKVLNFVERVTYLCATKVYTNSYGLMHIIINSQFCSTEKVKVLGNGSSNGIDTDFFHPGAIPNNIKNEFRQKYNIHRENFVYIYVGRLVPDKGINELIAAFRHVNFLYPKSKLLLVGHYEKDLYPLLSETIEEININSEIISVGFQSDVRPLLAISDCLVFPSYREGFPNAVMQAGAMGLPAIVSDINGCNEIIQEEFNGLIIPSKNIKALEYSMSRILKDTELKNKLAKNARESIISRFDNTTLWRLVKEEYDEHLRIARVKSKSYIHSVHYTF